MKRRVVAQTNNRIDYQSLALPKPEPRARIKARRDAKEAAIIGETHTIVFIRDSSCRACRGARNSWLSDQMHEIVPRSQTRGLDPADRFNSKNCVRVCAKCHQDITEHRLRVVPVSWRRGANGPLLFTSARESWRSAP